MAKSIEQIAAELADREAIRELPLKYCDCVWRGDVEGIEETHPRIPIAVIRICSRVEATSVSSW